MILPMSPDAYWSPCIPRESGDDPAQRGLWGGTPLVFPARAGMIPGRSEQSILLICIPRESGDDPGAKSTADGILEYSPRERG